MRFLGHWSGTVTQSIMRLLTRGSENAEVYHVVSVDWIQTESLDLRREVTIPPAGWPPTSECGPQPRRQHRGHVLGREVPAP